MQSKHLFRQTVAGFLFYKSFREGSEGKDLSYDKAQCVLGQEKKINGDFKSHF